ncbi:hypothetical protein GGX14DRAFT_367131 [Mycena pura]|uniref:Uncharacterized protein n=1 Tax=Mycena pura TaxID=153505 RepID=A0AAD6YB13_9AGAR|nr:hypothetical protein GGX14DRAFT_367131 [Mycena pura]
MSVDLLRNRDTTSPLGSFDGNVAALARIRGETYFITTNADYVPDVPSIQEPHALFLREDMRYGTDDPTLWPQQWSARYCHLAAIAKKGSRPELDVMWWDPTPYDFIVGSAVTRGLGRLRNRCIEKFLPFVNDITAQCKDLPQKSRTPLFGELIQAILMMIEQLQTLPTTYNKTVFLTTSLQRACLELDALYYYMTLYKPRMENYLSTPSQNTSLAQCMGAFTAAPFVAQQLWSAGLPFWFFRPTYVFDNENILAVVPLLEPSSVIHNPAGEGAPTIIYSGNSTDEKIGAIHHAAAQTSWYRDPFATACTSSNSLTPPAATHPTAVSHVASTSVPSSSVPRSSHQSARTSDRSPHESKTPSKAPRKEPAKDQRHKFTTLSVPEMPPSIVAWAEALAAVDRSVTPFTSDAADRRYVLPEPALLINSTPERQRKFLHHWNLLRDGFIYMLSQPQHVQLLTAAEWRDILEGLITKRGHPNSKTYRRSAQLEDRIRPVLEVCNLTSAEGFPVPLESLPEFSLAQTREIVWEVAETNFRFEFCALDRRASKKDRLEEVKRCFAGHMLIGAPLEMSKCGLAANTSEQRHRYILRAAILMLDWVTKSPRPPAIMPSIARLLNWSPSHMQALESAVCRYYTQTFWEYFGRAAVVPLCLDHDISK